MLPEDYYQQLEEIQAIDFVVHELTLYLDTHPNDQHALRQFQQFAHYKQQIQRDFESRYGSLVQNTTGPLSDEWNWGKGPWPWQV